MLLVSLIVCNDVLSWQLKLLGAVSGVILAIIYNFKTTVEKFQYKPLAYMFFIQQTCDALPFLWQITIENTV